MATLFSLPKTFAVQLSGIPYAAAKLYFYQAGTTTAATVYQDINLSVPHAQPVVANDQGFFPAIFLDPASTTNYKTAGTTSAGVTINGLSQDDIPATTVTQGQIAAAIYPESATETSATVTVVNSQYAYYTILRYVSDATLALAGALDVTSAMQAAHDACFESGGGTVMVGEAGASLRVDGKLDWDTNRVGFDGQGCYLNCVNRTSLNLFNIIQSDTDSLRRPALNASHPLRGFVAKGPSDTSGMLYLNDSTDHCVAGVVVKDGGSFDWGTHAYFGDGAFFTKFESWYFDSPLPGGGSDVMVYIPVGTNSGERNSFENCRFGVASDAQIVQNNGNADTHFIDCSFNGSARMLTQTAGQVTISNSHIESALDSDYWFHVSGANTNLTVSDSAILVGVNKTLKEIFYSNSDVTAGVVSVRDCLFGCSFTYTLPLIGGTGSAFVRDISTYFAGTQPAYYAASLDRMADGGFEAGNITRDGWSTSGSTTAPDANTTSPRTGTYVLRIQGKAGETNQAAKSITCTPGQAVTGICYMKLTGWTTPTQFLGVLQYLDTGGTALASSTFATIVADQGYTRTLISTYVRAPAGTATAKVTFSMVGTTTGTPMGYVDDIVLNVQ